MSANVVGDLAADGARWAVLGHDVEIVFDAVAAKPVATGKYAPTFDDAFGVAGADGLLANGTYCLNLGPSALLLNGRVLFAGIVASLSPHHDAHDNSIDQEKPPR